jgi:phosphoribosylaminoimidazole carboxylase (NCAIR synthetase)
MVQCPELCTRGAIALTSQFAQTVRAVCGWPLGDTARTGGMAVEMENLIGAEADAWADLLAEPGAHLHLYSARPRWSSARNCARGARSR